MAEDFAGREADLIIKLKEIRLMMMVGPSKRNADPAEYQKLLEELEETKQQLKKLILEEARGKEGKI